MYSTSDKKLTEAAKTFISDLKKVYQASSREIAENYLLELMGEKYPLVIKSWQNNWKNLSSIQGQLGGSTNSIEEENLLKSKVHLPACTSWYIVL